LGKLTLYGIFPSVGRNLGYVWLLRPHALGESTQPIYFPNCQNRSQVIPNPSNQWL